MLLEYVSLPYLRSNTYSKIALGAFPTSQSCENFAKLAKCGYYNGVIFHRIVVVCHPHSRLWTQVVTYHCLKDFMVQGGDPTGTGRGGTSIYGQKLYVVHTSLLLVVRLTQITHPSVPLAAKTRSIQSYGSRVPESSQWPTRVLTPMVRSFVLGILPDLLSVSSPFPRQVLHKTLTQRCTRFCFSRFAILYDAGPDAVLGQQTYDIWPCELGDARFAALGRSRGRCTGSVCICNSLFGALSSSSTKFTVIPNRPREEVKIHKARTVST